MAETELTDAEISGLSEVLAKIKAAKVYQNYEAGVRAILKRAQSLAGEGDVFARVGASLKTGKFPDYLRDCAKGQQRVQAALQAELKQKKLHGLLKNTELSDAIYGELYIRSGMLDKYLGKQSEDERMKWLEAPIETLSTRMKEDFESKRNATADVAKLGPQATDIEELINRIQQEYIKNPNSARDALNALMTMEELACQDTAFNAYRSRMTNTQRARIVATINYIDQYNNVEYHEKNGKKEAYPKDVELNNKIVDLQQQFLNGHEQAVGAELEQEWRHIEMEMKTQQKEQVLNGERQKVAQPELFDFPDYGEDFYKSEAVRELGISGNKITKEQKQKLEKLYEEYKQQKSSQGAEGQEAPKAQEAQKSQSKNGDGKGEGDNILEIDASPEMSRTNENDDPDWVKEYNEKLTQYGAANNNAWQRDNEPDENGMRPVGLKGAFANGTEAHYTDKNKLSVKTPEDKVPSADNFKEIVELAKDQNQIIKLGSNMSSEFKMALIEACAKGGVEIQNLSEDELNAYNSFKPQEEVKTKAHEGDKDFLKGGYDGYFSLESARVRYNMMERLATTPAKDAQFNELEDRSALDDKIASLKKAGAVIGKDSKESAELTLAEYAKASVALANNQLDEAGKERLTALEKALGCYNLDVYKEQQSDGKGGEVLHTVIGNKKAGERTLEEQEDIKYAVLKLQPQDKKYDTDIRNMTMSAIKNKNNGYIQ